VNDKDQVIDRLWDRFGRPLDPDKFGLVTIDRAVKS
jgi:hypothetical protein